MTTHTRTIDALNEICLSLGGSGGHAWKIDALNEWCSKTGKAAGHTRSINAYNALAGGTSYWLNLDAMNDISGDVGGGTSAGSSLEALNGIADEVSGGGGGSPAELAFADFVNGVYRIDGANVPVESLFGSGEWGNFNAATQIDPVHGLTGDPTLTPDLTAALFTTGFTIIGTFTAKGAGYGALNFNMFNAPEWDYEWFIELAYDYASGAASSVGLWLVDERATAPALSSVGPHRYAATVASGRLALSINGGPVLAIAAPADSGWSLLNNIAVITNSIEKVSTVGFYTPPQPDAVLPGLSA